MESLPDLDSPLKVLRIDVQRFAGTYGLGNVADAWVEFVDGRMVLVVEADA